MLNCESACWLQMRSTLLPGTQWDVMVDLFFYREPEETKEAGEEDAAEYGGDNQAYGSLPAPGGKLPCCSSAPSHTACMLYCLQCSIVGRLSCVAFTLLRFIYTPARLLHCT